jgi:hypothetical protein
MYIKMYIHVHVGMYLYVQDTDMSVHATTWYRHVGTVLPNPVQVIRIPDAGVGGPMTGRQNLNARIGLIHGNSVVQVWQCESP